MSSGEVVCAGAVVRVTPSIRWCADMISKINVSPLTFKTGTMDKIEEYADPHSHPDSAPDTVEVSRQARRVQILDADVRRYGFTDSCQRCEYLRQGRTLLARGVRHNEECRE